jgi:hypothetical protein
LLALRSQDGKAKKRVAAMLKRTKAANKAAIEDAVDNENTAVTLGGEDISIYALSDVSCLCRTFIKQSVLLD